MNLGGHGLSPSTKELQDLIIDQSVRLLLDRGVLMCGLVQW